jgi:hemerythrin-like domain-containing protein
VLTGSLSTPSWAAEDAGQAETGVSPAEDLMREHGVLDRLLLVYDEVLRRIGAKEEPPTKELADTVALVKSFIHDYHEKLEERHVFPRFGKADTFIHLTAVLRTQHRAGARLTERIRELTTDGSLADQAARDEVSAAMESFKRMYQPHAAREDTVLFPAMHQVVDAAEYTQLGEQFEQEEEKLFGKDGFAKVVEQVAAIEQALGIDDLESFTPK